MTRHNRDVIVAARMPRALRTDLEAVRDVLHRQGRRKADGRELDLSAVVRIAAGELRDRVLAGKGELLDYSSGETSARLLREDLVDGAARRARLGDLDRMAPATHRDDPATSKEAAAAAWPRQRGRRRRVLELLEAAGNRGYTGDELDGELGINYAGRRTLSELKRAGWVEVKRVRTDDGAPTPARRTTRLGNPAEVYVLTPAAVIKLGEERRRG